LPSLILLRFRLIWIAFVMVRSGCFWCETGAVAASQALPDDQPRLYRRDIGGPRFVIDQLRLEYALTRRVEVIAIDKGNGCRHVV
jgi:hypothetical protein